MAKNANTYEKRLRERNKQQKRLAKIAKRNERNAIKRQAAQNKAQDGEAESEPTAEIPDGQAAKQTAPAGVTPKTGESKVP